MKVNVSVARADLWYTNVYYIEAMVHLNKKNQRYPRCTSWVVMESIVILYTV